MVFIRSGLIFFLCFAPINALRHKGKLKFSLLRSILRDHNIQLLPAIPFKRNNGQLNEELKQECTVGEAQRRQFMSLLQNRVSTSANQFEPDSGNETAEERKTAKLFKKTLAFNKKSSFLFGAQECRERRSSADHVDEHLGERSICPWRWEMNTDQNRLPYAVLEGKCACELHAAGLAYECEPVFMKTTVLRFKKDCSAMVRVEEKVQVGCVTTFPGAVKAVRKPPRVRISGQMIETKRNMGEFLF